VASGNETNMSEGAQKEEEKARLEAELRTITEEKKAALDTRSKVDELLRNIKEREKEKKEKLQEIKKEEIERDQRERHAARLEAELKTAKQEAVELRDELKTVKSRHDQLQQKFQKSELERHTAHIEAEKNAEREAELRAGTEALKTENNQLKTESDQFQRKISEQNKSLINVKANLQHITMYAKNQQRQIRYLEDEISAAKQKSAETLLRELDEFRSLTTKSTELRQMITELQHQLQQKPATKEHREGKHYITTLCLVKK